LDRTSYYTKVTVSMPEGQVQELDYLWNSLGKIKLRYPFQYFRVLGQYEGRPDLISFQFYGDVSLWWVIMVANDIDDPITDLKPGIILKIPNVLDIQDFSRKYRVRSTR
jgi:hypothetical protein